MESVVGRPKMRLSIELMGINEGDGRISGNWDRWGSSVLPGVEGIRVIVNGESAGGTVGGLGVTSVFIA